MTDAPRPDEAPEPPPTSPYGPADGSTGAPTDAPTDGVEQLFGQTAAPAPEPVAPTAPSTGDSDAVTRARRTLRRLAIALPLAGLTLSIVAIIVQVSGAGSFFGIDPVSEIAGFTLTFLGPTLIVLGLHMIVWRAMVRPLSRATPGSRVGLIIGIGGVLSFLSVILIFVLIFAGFMLVSLLLSATDQAL